MSSNVRDLQAKRANGSDADAADGLTSDELRAEQAGDLPERDAMSILDVGGIGVGLPIPIELDPGDTLPVEPPQLGVVDQVLDGSQIDQALDGRIDDALDNGDIDQAVDGALNNVPATTVSTSETIS